MSHIFWYYWAPVLFEAFVIIVLLGGLEIVLARRQQRHDDKVYAEDKARQEAQLDNLDSIRAELEELNDKTKDGSDSSLPQ